MSDYRGFIKKISKDTGDATFNLHYIFSDAIENYCPPRPFSSDTAEREIYKHMIANTETHQDVIPVYYHDEWKDIIKATIQAYKDEKIGEIPESELGFSWETS